jgi:hypothetical protein
MYDAESQRKSQPSWSTNMAPLTARQRCLASPLLLLQKVPTHLLSAGSSLNENHGLTRYSCDRQSNLTLAEVPAASAGGANRTAPTTETQAPGMRTPELPLTLETAQHIKRKTTSEHIIAPSTNKDHVNEKFFPGTKIPRSDEDIKDEAFIDLDDALAVQVVEDFLYGKIKMDAYPDESRMLRASIEFWHVSTCLVGASIQRQQDVLLLISCDLVAR